MYDSIRQLAYPASCNILLMQTFLGRGEGYCTVLIERSSNRFYINVHFTETVREVHEVRIIVDDKPTHMLRASRSSGIVLSQWLYFDKHFSMKDLLHGHIIIIVLTSAGVLHGHLEMVGLQ